MMTAGWQTITSVAPQPVDETAFCGSSEEQLVGSGSELTPWVAAICFGCVPALRVSVPIVVAVMSSRGHVPGGGLQATDGQISRWRTPQRAAQRITSDDARVSVLVEPPHVHLAVIGPKQLRAWFSAPMSRSDRWRFQWLSTSYALAGVS